MDFPQLEHPVCPITEDDAYYSAASLENVSSARLFYSATACHCRGILFEYCNGGRQAVGQCGLGIFPTKLFLSPLVLYYRPIELEYGAGVLVDFGTQATGDTDWTGWMSEKMSGTITFWFNCDSVVLQVKHGLRGEV